MKRIIAILLGILMYLALAISLSDVADIDDTRIPIVITIVCILLIIGIVALIHWGMDYFLEFYVSMVITNLVLAIASPFLLIGLKVYLHHQKEKSAIADKEVYESFTLHSDSAACVKVRYGTFVHYHDTIMRFRTDTGDYEIIKRGYNNNDTCKINWFNECSYQKIPLNRTYITKVITIGNVTDDSCVFYTRSFGRMNLEGNILNVKILKLITTPDT